MKIYTILKNIAKKVSLDYVHPIGEIFISCDADFNPNDTWGGVWQKLTDKFLVGAGNDYALGDVGGEAEHTLTLNEMPIHSHPLDMRLSATTGGYYAQPPYSANNGTLYERGTKNAGGSQPHNNLPPYQAVFMWQRTA